MATRKPATTTDESDDAFEGVMARDNERVAEEFQDELDGLAEIKDQASIKGILYHIPRANGAYEWMQEIYPPFNVSEIMQYCKDQTGGGNFCLRVMVAKKVRKNLMFSIRKDPNWKQGAHEGGIGSNNMDFIQLLMTQQNASKTDMQTMMQSQAQQTQAMMTMMMNMQQQSTQMMVGFMTAAMGGREKLSDVIAAATALNPQKEDGMEKTLALLTTAKGLFGDGGNGDKGLSLDSLTDIVTAGAKVAGPLLESAGDALARRRANAAQPQTAMVVPDGPAAFAGPGSLAIPQGNVENPSSRFPFLELIRPDVLFMFSRGHSPEMTAEVVLEKIEQAQVSEEDLLALVTAFQISPNWLEDLAAEGIDLRSNPEWANLFLSSLVQLYTDPGDIDDDTGRGSGGETNARRHGGLEPPRVATDADKGSGG